MKKKKTTVKLIGIDEAGRGPLAGPVAVGLVCVPASFDFGIIPGIRDSKKLSEKKREEVMGALRACIKEGVDIRYSVVFGSARDIDRYGIQNVIKTCISELLEEYDPGASKVLLDGLLSAPEEFRDQETIIRGDDTEKVISLASICAKVERDRYMKACALEYPLYGFERHKGYGTTAHISAIKEYGASAIHRATYIRKIGEERA